MLIVGQEAACPHTELVRERPWLLQLRSSLSMCLCLCVLVSPLLSGQLCPHVHRLLAELSGKEISFRLLHLCLFCILDQNSVLNTPDLDTRGPWSPQVRVTCLSYVGVGLPEAQVL